MNPKKLPIYELRNELTDALRTENRILIEAPTGSGKSTQIPQIVLDGGTAGPGEVVVLQPRRLAARLLARRVAFERKVELLDPFSWKTLTNLPIPITQNVYRFTTPPPAEPQQMFRVITSP